MAAFTLMAVLQLMVGSAFYLGATGLPSASLSSSDTCPLEGGEGFDGLSLLSFSTQLAKQHSMKLQPSAQVTAVLRTGKKCATAKCLECRRMWNIQAQKHIDSKYGAAATTLTPSAPWFSLCDKSPDKIMSYIEPSSTDSGSCDEIYGLAEGSQSKGAPPVFCSRQHGKVLGGMIPGLHSLSQEQICEGCVCDAATQSQLVTLQGARADQLAWLEKSLSEKVGSTLSNVLSKVLGKAADLAKKLGNGLVNFFKDPRKWFKDAKNQRLALKVFKGAVTVVLAVGAATGVGIVLAPATIFAISSALALAQSGHAYYHSDRSGHALKQATGLLLFRMTIGGITSAVAIPDVSASWLLDGMGGVAKEALGGVTDAADGALLPDGFLSSSIDGFNEGAEEVAEASLPEKAARLALKAPVVGPASYLDKKVWSDMAKRKEQADMKKAPAVAQALALQAKLCNAATDEWAPAMKASMKDHGLEGGKVQVTCGMVSSASVEAEMAAGRDVLAEYKPTGEPVPDSAP